MPFVRIRGYRFGLFSSEPAHEPTHIHVEGNGGSAKLWLRPIRLIRSTYSKGKTREIVRIARKHEEEFLEIWRERFGDPQDA